jgi:GDP-L-fucose synthase
MFSLNGKTVWVAGHQGMVGRALVRRLQSEKCQILTADRATVDLRRQADVEDWIAEHKPQAVFLAAAKVGGILANDSRPAEFLYDNVQIGTNVIEASRRCGVEKLMFLGSSCIYPKHAAQPIHEDALLTGPLEPTNQWYAVAKIADLMLARAYKKQYGFNAIAAMPTNLYGPFDKFDLQTSHVVPALIRKAHEAQLAGAEEFVVWGSGNPRREFMYVDDLADALVLLMKNYDEEEHVNVGVGSDITIRELAEAVAAAVGFKGRLTFDSSKPDGTPRKLLNIDRLRSAGWQGPTTSLEDGLRKTFKWYLEASKT